MRSVVMERPGHLEVREVPEPVASVGQVVVSVAYAGLCGSDLDLAEGRRPPGYMRYPVTPGHEWSGIVSAVGSDVDPQLIGRKVVGEGFEACESCPACMVGESPLCEAGYEEIGFTQPGAWAEQLLIPARQLHVLPDHADLRAAAGLEPAACAADMVLRAAPQPGQRIAVVGAGTIGSLVLQLLRAHQPSELVAIDPSTYRGERALRCGASSWLSPDEAVNVSGCFDLVIEAAGTDAALSTSYALLRRGGHLVIAGVPGPTAVLHVADLVSKRLSVSTVFGAPRRAWSVAVEAFERGVLDPAMLVSQDFELADAAAALDRLRLGAAGKLLLAAGASRHLNAALSSGGVR